MTFDFAAARQNMVDCQVRPADVTDLAIQDAMLAVARETLCPPGKTSLAYADVEIPCGEGRFLMRPRDVGKLLQALRPKTGEKALAIAAPYAAQVLEAMGLEVDRLDGENLLAAKTGLYDVVICEGAVSAAPPAWLKALGEGGRLALVERDGPVGRARLYARTEQGIGARDVFDATPPVLPGFERKSQFAF
jgi:protein-L-isoaspartate(D-aspartate) O-methyltransferase